MPRRGLTILVAALATAIAAAALTTAPALAVIHPSGVLDGPANDILEVAGAAMAPDGSGGVLYREQLEGVPHLFAIPFANGRWGAPAEVDGEDHYGASQPAIAAGSGGRLLVVWVQPRNVDNAGVKLYELQSASILPGSANFGQAITIDPNVGEPYSGNAGHVEPRLAMAPDGVAYVVYRVLTDECLIIGVDAENPLNGECPANAARELVEVRVARFDYLLWSSLDAINRDSQIAMPTPTPANAPAIGIDEEGGGVVAWQEPEDTSEPPRIWARRLFGATQGSVLSASPEKLAGKPVTSPAEAPTVAVSRFGEAKIAFQIDGGQGSAVPATQLYVNSLPSELDPNGGKLEGAVALPGAAASGIGAPVAALGPSGEYQLVWTQDDGVRQASGNRQGKASTASVGAGSGAVGTTVNPAGGGTTAWATTAAGLPVVEAREEYAHGAWQTARLAGDLGGPVSGLSFAGSGQGDALIAWMQGPPGDSEVVGDFVQAPPPPFVVSTPRGWVRSRNVPVEWEPTSDAVPDITYAVYIDGRQFRSGLTATHANLGAVALGDGVHQVQVLASDSAGQRTMSAKTELKVDAEPPIVRIALIDHRRGVRVTVREKGPGVDVAATRISFGDGALARGRASARHVYRRAGLYTITAHVRDNVGNEATVHLRARVK